MTTRRLPPASYARSHAACADVKGHVFQALKPGRWPLEQNGAESNLEKVSAPFCFRAKVIAALRSDAFSRSYLELPGFSA